MELNTTDTHRLSNEMNNLMDKVQETLKLIMNDDSEELYLSVNNLLELWMEFSRHTVINQEQLSEVQISYWQDFLLLCKDLNLRLKEKIVAANPAMRKSVLLTFVEKYYFTLAHHMSLLIRAIFTEADNVNNEQIKFYNNHFIEALSRNSFIHIDDEHFYQGLLQ